MAGERTESILAFDCGSAFSRAVLLDAVDGEFRLVARGEAPTTTDDVAKGLAEAVREIESNTGRKLLAGQHLVMPEGLDGSGVDAAVLAWSAGKPIRLITAGITSSQSTTEAAAAVAGAAAEVVATFCLQDIRPKQKREHKSEEISRSQADGVLVVAGTNSGNPLLAEIAEFVAMAKLSGSNGARLPLVIAGDPSSHETVGNILGAVLDAHNVEPVRRAAGSCSTGQAATCLNDLYLSLTTAALRGSASLVGSRWSAAVAVPKAIGAVAQFYARQLGADVLVVDLGASLTTIATSTNGQADTRVWTSYGMGSGIGGVATGAGVESIANWLPFACDEETVLTVGLNKGLRPQTIAELREESLVEEAFARAAIGYAAGNLNIEPGAIIATGGFLAHLARPGSLALLLVDALQPRGVTTIAYDDLGLLPALGAVAHAFPQAAGEVLAKDTLAQLGTVVPVLGMGKDGRAAARVGVKYANGSEVQVDVPWGEIRTIPLAEGQKAHLSVKPEHDLHVGYGRKGRSVEMDVGGGALGIIVDARGRPLPLSTDPPQRWNKLAGWYGAMASEIAKGVSP